MAMHRSQAGTPNEHGWYEGKSTEGSFTVFLPMPFNDFTLNSIDAKGRKTKAFVIGAKKNPEGIKFSVTEYRQRTTNVDQAIKESLASVGPDKDISDQRRLSFKGYPAFQFKAQSEENHWLSYQRAIYLPDRTFLMIVESPSGYQSDVEPYLDAFFKSLDIKKAKEQLTHEPIPNKVYKSKTSR
jgi:hypothetical protein